jgi:hypothetical protein
VVGAQAARAATSTKITKTNIESLFMIASLDIFGLLIFIVKS